MILGLSILIMFKIFLILKKKQKSKSKMTINLLGISSIMKMIISMLWMIVDFPLFIMKMNWKFSKLQNFKLSFIVDSPYMMFSSMALFVTWSIIEFSHYYMSKDHKKQQFLKTLIFFLFFMLLLVASKNLFLLFVGWEGVGMLSFMLISWWFTRSDAKKSALQAMIYKRMGDSGIMLFMTMSMMTYNSWKLKEMMFLKNFSPMSYWATLGMILAAMGKSAQFSLHPWLPSAMEGPTPVSALLHSSTMVVAGVFLLFRCSPLMLNSLWTLSLMGLMGSLTALFAASTALGQFDLKKIMAYSTTSQLGLMTVAMSIKSPKLALFHICTHAFFKSLLFLCSGKIIHSLKKEQDMRKMSNMASYLPLTTKFMMMGSLALSGMPFLAGFYSKDLMLESSQKKICKSMKMILALMATFLTALYSARMIFYMTKSSNKFSPITPIKEENFNSMNPLLRLMFGALVSGWILSITLFKIETITLPWIHKIIPSMLSMYAIIMIFNNKNMLKIKPQKIFTNSIKFLSKNWFFVQLFHGKIFWGSKILSLKGIKRTIDQGWNSFLLSKWIPKNLITQSKLIQKIHSGVMINYILFSIIFISMIFMSFNLF